MHRPPVRPRRHPERDSLPNIAVGRHPVPDHPTLYALTDQRRDGQGRTTRAVEMLRKAGHRVDVSAAFDPSPASVTAPARDRLPRTDPPDVAFAEHPQLGILAAASANATVSMHRSDLQVAMEPTLPTV
ncbi:hypothetical protein [Streptomyces beijiangensis]|uniref:hypothetical protein n=1 Tax=Streptomyces beijiangensis TaxID=163361 RepID=UPI001F5DF7D5|nr:hypothetical protein [Streptomyces beijiangensis]